MTIPLPQIFHVAAGLLVSLLAVNQAVAEEPKPEPQQTILQSRQSLAEDPFRPLYHFSSPKGNYGIPVASVNGREDTICSTSAGEEKGTPLAMTWSTGRIFHRSRSSVV